MAFLNPTVPIWLEINNDEYKTCIEEELVKQNFCVQKCPADEDCLSNCIESFLETTRKCRLPERHLPGRNNGGDDDGTVDDEFISD
jgi:hypothetical protein